MVVLLAMSGAAMLLGLNTITVLLNVVWNSSKPKTVRVERGAGATATQQCSEELVGVNYWLQV